MGELSAAAKSIAYYHKRKKIDPEWYAERLARTRQWKKNAWIAKSAWTKTVMQKNSEWRTANPEARARISKRYELANKEALKEKRRIKFHKNPELHRSYVQRRRARKARAEGAHTREQWLDKIAFHGWRCFYCKRILTVRSVTKDHRKPLCNGGPDWVSNLVPACLSCNCSKSHRKAPTVISG